MFYRSISCINHWFVPGHEAECHEDCILLGAVPAERKTEHLPCHFIPLNEAGETVKSLEERGDRERLQDAVKEWLRTTIQRLKRGEDALALPEAGY
jgi:hypothetical protein